MDDLNECVHRDCARRITPVHWAIVALAVFYSDATTLDARAQAPSPQEAEILAARWEGHHADARNWTVFTFGEVTAHGADLLNTSVADLRDFCPIPAMGENDMTNFFVYLISSVAELESNFDPATQYRESTILDSQGRPVISRGLLQLSLESANGYGCGFLHATDLHDPERNLSCGIRILARWIGTDARIGGRDNGNWQGAARYWSVLRRPNAVEQIRKWTSSYCIQHFGGTQ